MASLSGLHPIVRDRVRGAIDEARRSGIAVTITSGFRSPASQRRLYAAFLARGRTGLPAAVPGTSTHEFGLAVDLVTTPGELERFARIAACWGLVWAGRRDRVHFDPFGFEAWSRVLQGQIPEVRYAC